MKIQIKKHEAAVIRAALLDQATLMREAAKEQRTKDEPGPWLSIYRSAAAVEDLAHRFRPWRGRKTTRKGR